MFEDELLEELREGNRRFKELLIIMATLDEDVQAATVLIGDLVTALVNATTAASPVPVADQSALEAAIASGQSALAGASGATGATGPTGA